MGVFILMSITTRALIISFSIIKTHSVMDMTLIMLSFMMAIPPSHSIISHCILVRK